MASANAKSALSAAIALAALGGAFGATSCGRAVEPTNQTIATCEASCNARASRQCSSDECNRGCEFILDRILERESDNVIACVARSARRCSDIVWADCAANIGPHADGGPPAPPPPPEDD